MSVTARKYRLGLYLKSKDRRLSRNIAKKSVITNSKQLTQKKRADSYKDNCGDRNWNFVKLVNKVLQKWKNYGNSRFLPQFAVEIPTLPVDQCHSHLIQYLKGCCDILSYRRAAKKGRQAFGTQPGISGNVFADPHASSSAPYPQELNQWEEPLHSSTVEKSERPEQNQDLRCQSGPSAKDSVIFSGGDSSKNYGADQQRLQILDLHFDKFPTPATFACWKKRFKTEVCICSQFPTEAMQWIKEVEMVDSVDD